MNQAATVHSIDAVRDFRAALQDFCEETRAALVDVDLELRRSLEWLLEQQPAYWRNEVRKANDTVVQAKIELHRARMKTLPGGGTPSCMEERKAVDRAERQLRYAEEKVEIVREWGRVQQLEVNEYAGRATQLTGALDVTVPRATRFLDQAIGHLESYVAVGGAAGSERGPVSIPLTSSDFKTDSLSLRERAGVRVHCEKTPPSPCPLPEGEGSETAAGAKSDADQKKSSPASPDIATGRDNLPGEPVAEPSP